MSITPLEAQIKLGEAIANMYIAAQHVSQEASDCACEAMEKATPWMKFAFNRIMAKSPYNIKA